MSGTSGKAKGGIARRNALAPARRAEIAKKAALSRWGAKATHKGSFREEFGIDVECYVLDDENKTAVISQTGMGEALGLGRSGGRLPRFVSGKTISNYVGPELRKKLDKPVIFQGAAAGPGMPMVQIHGYDVTILIDLCKAVVDAEADGKLLPHQSNIAKQAHIILSASAKAGIKGLVYALAGYNPSTQEVIEAFKLYVLEEAKKYEPEFPNELYMQWHRLYDIPVLERGRSWHFRHLTVRHVYHPLAKSNGKILTLLRALKATGGNRGTKLFQFLNDIGARALRMHLGRLMEMAESSADQAEYEKKIRERFGDQQELELVTSSGSTV